MVNCATLCCSTPPSTMHSPQVSDLQWCLRASSISCFDRQGPSRKVPSAVGRAGPWPRRPTRFVHAGSQRLSKIHLTSLFPGATVAPRLPRQPRRARLGHFQRLLAVRQRAVAARHNASPAFPRVPGCSMAHLHVRGGPTTMSS